MLITDQNLIKKIVNQQIFQIRLQRLFRDHPLAMPLLTPEERKKQDVVVVNPIMFVMLVGAMVRVGLVCIH